VSPLRAVVLALALALGACAHPVVPRTDGSVDLVESVPLETNLDHTDIPDAYELWPAMIAATTRTLDLAEFYVSDAPGSRLGPVLAAIEAAARRGVAVRLLVDAMFAKKYPESLDRLAAVPGVAVRRFDVGAVMGGVLHAKYFVVDGRETYLGSQNFDWRSLTHIHEIGVRLRDPAATATFARVFELDWGLAGRAASGEPATAAPQAAAPPGDVSAALSFVETAGGAPVMVTPVASPRGFLPDPRTWELPRIVALLDGAKRSVHVQVLTYDTVNRDGSPFPDLDDALRRAAARGVEVSLLVSDWAKKKGPREAVQALARAPGIKVRFIDVPPWSGGFVAFARVAHAKYMVVDGARAWVGTSNWEGDYFTRSRNVGLVVEGEAFARGLERVFHDAFDGPYGEVVDPSRAYEPPKIAEPAAK
jgi:phosphatidylserine/phosphatidylglycerophosphate/cardiolipin synthase-like enzyme